ncbi:MAG: hypothetical protein COA50_02870 [Flavobacteriaceae bacterium]|nr:MAG: hypothetical protein COA50_02870 [Flavobacteriaceae bacterium]
MDLNLLSHQLSEQLNSLNQNLEKGTKETNTSIVLCRKLLTVFHNNIASNKFSSTKNEIEFFKTIKQVPLHNLIYYSEVRSFELHYPRANREKQESYIRQRMDKTNRFFIYNIDFVEYVEMGNTYFDEQYYTRKYFNEQIITHTKFYYLHPNFNTSHDMLLAKLKAYQRLITYFYGKLNLLENSNFHANQANGKLQWTSSKVALTELVYALYHSGAINKGNVDIKEIATALQHTFNFELGDYYRTYTEIRSRKKSKAKFMDELSNSLSTKLNSDDGLK